jgi:hypothetical protein
VLNNILLNDEKTLSTSTVCVIQIRRWRLKADKRLWIANCDIVYSTQHHCIVNITRKSDQQCSTSIEFWRAELRSSSSDVWRLIGLVLILVCGYFEGNKDSIMLYVVASILAVARKLLQFCFENQIWLSTIFNLSI